MTLEQIKNKTGIKVKVIFKEHDVRFPMIGKIVRVGDIEDPHSDAHQLAKKDMIRFVNQSRLDVWKDDEPAIALTRIYVVKDFAQVIPM